MTIIFKLEGIDCANCAAKIERGIGKIKGVSEVRLDFMTSKLFVDTRDVGETLIDEIKAVVAKTDRRIKVKEV